MTDDTQRRVRVGADKIGLDDPRYADLASRGSKRFAGQPDYVRLVGSTAQVVDALQDVVREQRRVADDHTVSAPGSTRQAFAVLTLNRMARSKATKGRWSKPTALCHMALAVSGAQYFLTVLVYSIPVPLKTSSRYI